MAAPYDGTKGFRIEMNVPAEKVSDRGGLGMFGRAVAELTGCALDINQGVLPKLAELALTPGIMLHIACVDEYIYGTDRETREKMVGVVWHLMDVLSPSVNIDGTVKPGYYMSKYHQKELQGSQVPSRHAALQAANPGANQVAPPSNATSESAARADVVRNTPPPTLDEERIAAYDWKAILNPFVGLAESQSWRELRATIREADVEPTFLSSVMMPPEENPILSYLMAMGYVVPDESGEPDSYHVEITYDAAPVDEGAVDQVDEVTAAPAVMTPIL